MSPVSPPQTAELVLVPACAAPARPERSEAGGGAAGRPAVPIAPRRRLRVMCTVTVSHDLHLRIAAQFVQLASRFESKIILAKGRRRVDGKSILGVLMLGVARESRLRIIAIGRDAEQAIRALTPLFRAHPRHPAR